MTYNYPAHWNNTHWNYKAKANEGNWNTVAHTAHSKNAVEMDSLFPKFDRWAIGFDSLVHTLTALSEVSKKSASYPPFNISKFGGGKYEVLMAVAGFRREEINVTVKDRVLTVTSDSAAYLGDEETVAVGELLHQGIAQRDFTQTFALGEHVEVESASLEDGLLRIKLVTNTPEEKKPKTIEVK